MRIRRFDPGGDYTFGQSQANYVTNLPETVGQYALCRLMLWLGQWFGDTSQGTDWATQVLGERTQATRDLVLQGRVNGTPGVTSLTRYNSRIDRNTRTFAAAMTIDTIYGPALIAVTPLPATIPPLPVAPAPPTGQRARMLGVSGTPNAAISDTPADLTQGLSANVTNFVVASLDAGTY